MLTYRDFAKANLSRKLLSEENQDPLIRILDSEEPFDTQACTPEDRKSWLDQIRNLQRELNRTKKRLSKITKELLK